MKKWIVLLFAICFLSPVFAADSSSVGVVSAKQPVYSLHLPANPTTGYSWYLVSYPEASLSLLKHVYLPQKTQNVGSGGFDLWQFKAKPGAFIVPRVFEIKMMYARSWEINDKTPVKTFYVVTQA